jgi:hypothetical protein
MGIKMKMAVDQNGRPWPSDEYIKGKGAEPLLCEHCKVTVTHNSEHVRDLDGKSILVPAYFKLMPGKVHAVGACPYAIDATLLSIVDESKDMFVSLGQGEYRMRLNMIKDNIKNASSASQNKGSGISAGANSNSYIKSGKQKLPYINSAKRVLELRAACDSQSAIADKIKLVFGKESIGWDKFYFEADGYLDALKILASGKEYPIAIHGVIKSKRIGVGKNKSNVINLYRCLSVADQDDSSVGANVEVSVWAKDATWFGKVDKGDEVIILALWRSNQGDVSEVPDKEFKKYRTDKISTTLVVASQLIKI